MATRILTPIVLLLLLGVVVVASSADLGGESLDAREATGALATLLFALGAVWVAGLLVASPLATGLTARAEVAEPRRWSHTIAVILIVFAILFMLSGAGRLGNRGPNRVNPAAPTGEQVPQGRGPGRYLPTPAIDWVVVLAVFGVAFVGFAAAARMVVRSNKAVIREVAAREALAAILDDTLDDLRAEPDPRKAVIACYSKMERSLASYGLPRHPFEAPEEYLGRVLDELQSGSPAARRLTRLFERAKFSEHSIDTSMKDEAIDAVSELRSELTGELVEANA
ncbi:MAG TPA: DUF4129 domain-containing protein [Gaiellaceae bacterium]|nr:DUF4129 domain-containing protein [Gaiellaceae bacterium]